MLGSRSARRTDDAAGRRIARLPGALAVAVVLVTIAGLAYVLGWYAPMERTESLEQWRSILAAMGEDRQVAIESWVASGLADARHVATFPTAVRLAADRRALIQRSPESKALDARLTGLLDDLVGLGDFAAAYVLDETGRSVASNTAATPLVEPCAQAAIDYGRAGAPTVGLQLHPGGPPAVAFVAPIRETGVVRGERPVSRRCPARQGPRAVALSVPRSASGYQ